MPPAPATAPAETADLIRTSDRQLRLVQRRRPLAVLLHALELRPQEVYLLYGIPSPTQHKLCRLDTDPMPAPRMLSGRKGHKGVRLYNHAELRAWIARQPRTTDPEPATAATPAA